MQDCRLLVILFFLFSQLAVENAHAHHFPKDTDPIGSRIYKRRIANPGGSHCEQQPQSERSVALSRQKGASIALKAAEEARAASNAQAAAGEQAAHQVKVQLAEKAFQAAKAAEAALAGKQSIVEQLENEVHDAEAIVQEEANTLQNTQKSVNSAMQATRQATEQLRTLTHAAQTAQANVINSEQVAQGTQEEVAVKAQLIEVAKTRIEQLLRQLSEARADYAKTKQAAYKASAAAHEAWANAGKNRRRRKTFMYEDEDFDP